jgi:hypothetical protein
MAPTIRSQTRGPTLAAALSQARLRNAWKSTVRPGLRKQAIGDLHDYLDVHRRISAVAARIHNEVVAGTYRVNEPQFVTWEKSNGITRRIVIPSPEDAIVLQAIIDSIQTPVLAAAGTENAFYARSHAPPSIEAVDDTFPYPWWELWPEFQRRIWQFGRSSPYVVMTDIANYFDAIPLQTLRNRITAVAHLREEIVDFLFFLLEGMEWRPDYIPASGVGLPQIQFDAPRLLAHSYLFEVDNYLQSRSVQAFTRWMDDITVGVGSISEAKTLLRDLDEMMAAMGLRINAGKTKILPGKEALEILWMRDNRRLNWLQKFMQANGNPERALNYALKRFRSFWSAPRVGNWAKVLRRYLTVFTKLKSSRLDRHIPEILREIPSARDKVFRYWQVLGFSPRRFRDLESYLMSKHCLDDVALYSAMSLLWTWAIPRRSPYRRRVLQLALGAWDARRESHIAVACAAAILGKYASSAATARFILQTSREWRRSEWAGRQIAAIVPVLNEADSRSVVNLIVRYGMRDATEVLLNLHDLRGVYRLDPQLRGYLFYPRGDYAYPWSKVLIALGVLKGDLDPTDRAALLQHIETDSGDARYLELVRAA